MDIPADMLSQIRSAARDAIYLDRQMGTKFSDRALAEVIEDGLVGSSPKYAEIPLSVYTRIVHDVKGTM